VGASGAFAGVPGGYIADATSGPGEATRVTRVSVNLPAAADGQPLVQLRVITANAAGQDEWVGIDDIEISAASVGGGGAGGCAQPPPGPAPPPGLGPAPKQGPAPRPVPAPKPAPGPPNDKPPKLTGLELSPTTFMPANHGSAIVRRGRAGTALRFRLSRAALVRFEVVRSGGAPEDFARKPWPDDFAPKPWRARVAATIGAGARGDAPATGGRFSTRGRPGLNRLRFSGRVRGRPLAEGAYVLRAVATDRAGRTSAPTASRFRIRGKERAGRPSPAVRD
jgi:hypothetical protein